MGRSGSVAAGVRLRLALELAWSRSRDRDCLRIDGWSDRELDQLRHLSAPALARLVAVLPSELDEAASVAGDDGVAFQPAAGELAVDRNGLCFTPRFPFVDGVSYTVRVGEWTASIARSRRERAASTQVLAIYPAAGELPLNQLKLYIVFSSAMSEGWAGRAVSLRRADRDQPLEGALLAMEPELWDRGRTRLTVLLEPGRIKRGVAPHEQAGYPLDRRVPVVLSVDRSFRDADGDPLRSGAERCYRVGAAVRSKVDPDAWRIVPPIAGSRDPLTIEFDRPLDRALLEHSLMVRTENGSEIAGHDQVGSGEYSWRFMPGRPWAQGAHELVVDARLEDLAGNSLARVFDRDLSDPADDPLDTRRVAVPFHCRASG